MLRQVFERQTNGRYERDSQGRVETVRQPYLGQSSVSVAISLITIAGVIWTIEFVELPSHNQLWKELQDAGHVPLFGVLAIAARSVSTQLLGERLRSQHRHYLLALVVSIFLAATTEWLQIYTGRDAEVLDVLRDVLGAASFLGLAALRDAHMRPIFRRSAAAVRRALGMVAVIFLVTALAPLGFWAIAYANRNLAFPKIVSFSSFWQRQFLLTQDADLAVARAPKGWTILADKYVGRVVLKPGAYPGFSVQEVYPDWRGYRFICFDIYSEMSYPIQLTLRVHDHRHNNQYSDRFNHRLDVLPGINSYRIPVESIQTGPAHRLLNLKDVAAIALFAMNRNDRYALDVDSIWLE
jgi:VanZ family protein